MWSASPLASPTSNADAPPFASLGLADYLDGDARPTFVLDLAAVTGERFFSSAVCYLNPALRTSASLEAQVNGIWKAYEDLDVHTRAFQDWAVGDEKPFDETQKKFAGFTWVRISLQSRWRAISACEALDGGRPASQPLKSSADADPMQGSPGVVWSPSVIDDWTTPQGNSSLSPIIQVARGVDWSQTALGPMKSWSSDFRRVCNYLMADPMAASLMWGKDWNLLYNEEYSAVAGKKHPHKFGAPFADIYNELPEVSMMLDRIRDTRRAIRVNDSIFFLQRHGYLEETYFTFTLIPIAVNDQVMGVYNSCFEQTRQHIAERRMATLIKISAMTSGVKTLETFWTETMRAFQVNEYDIPFASIYAVANVEDFSDTASVSTESSGQHFSKHCLCEASFGLPDTHPAAAQEFNINTAHGGIAPYLREAAKTDSPSVWHVENDSPFALLFSDIVCKPFGDTCRSVVIAPIRPTTGLASYGAESFRAFVILGLNPRRPYDTDYEVFVQLLSRLVATSMATTMLFEEDARRSKAQAEQAQLLFDEEVKRGQAQADQAELRLNEVVERGQADAEQAALEQLKLEEELEIRAQEAIRSEMKFTHFADNAPVGINVFDVEGRILYANDVWYDVTQHPRDDMTPMSWMKSFYMEEVENAGEVWHTLLEEKRSVTFESRLRRPWTPPNTDDAGETLSFTWVLCSAYPELKPDGSVEAIVGCFMDISQQKWIEDLQKRRMNEAIEARRLQESFIDMTSHEMRNPLSAIVHCADGIINGLTPKPEARLNSTYLSNDDVMSSLDAARTIIHCANHQKRIVDDILTLSKLDSGLLPVTPETVRLVTVVEDTLRMFGSELKAADMELRFEVDDSLQELGVEWVKIDPSRLTQVLINLLTNAIKFTQTEENRIVRVRLGACSEQPSGDASHVKFVQNKDPNREDITAKPEWGSGDEIYLLCVVEDTGRGLTDAEIDMLFRRFSQATPRTHVQYGGSGLGLFISRELTEMQGGEIGVSSKSGKGSTFAFYVKSRKAEDPATPGSRPTENAHVASFSRSTPELSPISIGPAVFSRQDSNMSMSPTRKSPARFPILIVEDNLVNRKVLSKQLRLLGFVVEEANHGLEALEKLQDAKFWAGKDHGGSELCMVLMDIEMPVMDGLTAMRRIRALQAAGTMTAHVPTIAVTANARKEQVDAALAAGMDMVVSKPFRIPDLVKRMESLRERVAHNHSTRERLSSFTGR